MFRFAIYYNGPGQADYYGGLIAKWVQSFGLLRQDPNSASFAYQDNRCAEIWCLDLTLPSPSCPCHSQPGLYAGHRAVDDLFPDYGHPSCGGNHAYDNSRNCPSHGHNACRSACGNATSARHGWALV